MLRKTLKYMDWSDYMLYKNLIVQNDLKEMLEDKNISWDKLKIMRY